MGLYNYIFKNVIPIKIIFILASMLITDLYFEGVGYALSVLKLHYNYIIFIFIITSYNINNNP